MTLDNITEYLKQFKLSVEGVKRSANRRRNNTGEDPILKEVAGFFCMLSKPACLVGSFMTLAFAIPISLIGGTASELSVCPSPETLT